MDYFSAPDIKSHIEAKWSFCSIEIICSDVDLFQNFVKKPNIGTYRDRSLRKQEPLFQDFFFFLVTSLGLWDLSF